MPPVVSPVVSEPTSTPRTEPFKAPVGTRDVLPPESDRWQALIATFAQHVGRAVGRIHPLAGLGAGLLAVVGDLAAADWAGAVVVDGQLWRGLGGRAV